MKKNSKKTTAKIDIGFGLYGLLELNQNTDKATELLRPLSKNQKELTPENKADLAWYLWQAENAITKIRSGFCLTESDLDNGTKRNVERCKTEFEAGKENE